MTAGEFLDQVVRPSVAEQKADFGDLRKAFNALHAVDAVDTSSRPSALP